MDIDLKLFFARVYQLLFLVPLKDDCIDELLEAFELMISKNRAVRCLLMHSRPYFCAALLTSCSRLRSGRLRSQRE